MPKNTKKSTPAKKIVSAVKRTAVKAVTEVRNTAIPKLKAAKKFGQVALTQDQIAKRAYEIYAGGTGGSEADNWFRAERELRGGI